MVRILFGLNLCCLHSWKEQLFIVEVMERDTAICFGFLTDECSFIRGRQAANVSVHSRPATPSER